MNNKVKNIPVLILCGGKGTRLSEETIAKPKPMVEIGGMPILWHIMKSYSFYGFNRFILALGYKGDYIKKYFYDYKIRGVDFKIKYNPEFHIEYLKKTNDNDWEITFVDTGENTLKGGRIKRVAKYIENDQFHLTYGDGVCDVNLNRLLEFHNDHGGLGTVTAVRPPSRFGELTIDNNNTVRELEEKPQMGKGLINGGYFVFNADMLKYLSEDEKCDFEFGPLQKISGEGKLKAFKHDGFWQCMDNVRERDYLDKQVNNRTAPWIVW